MTLDINKNNSFFNNENNKNNKKKKDDDEDSEKQEQSEDKSTKQKNYHAKEVDASSLEVLGMQNALMIHQESIVHMPHKNIEHVKNASDMLQNDDTEDSAKNEDFTNKANYEKLGITQNQDGTFSIKNNPFGKFTKATIEDYINKYIIPSLSDAWINGYSKLYTVNSRKILLMKVTTKDGKKVFKGRIIEDGEKYIIFYGVKDNGQPDENNIIKKVKVTPPSEQ